MTNETKDKIVKINEKLDQILNLATEIVDLASEIDNKTTHFHLSEFLHNEFISKKNLTVLSILKSDTCGINYIKSRFANLVSIAESVSKI